MSGQGGMDEVFGQRRRRPNHPDFWRISESILANDAPMDEARDDEERERAWRARTSSVVDVESVVYAGLQRGMRAGKALPERARGLAADGVMTTLWVDAFVTGAMFEQAGGHREPASDELGTFIQITEGYAALTAGNAPRDFVVLLRQLDELGEAVEQSPAGLGELRSRFNAVRLQVEKMSGVKPE